MSLVVTRGLVARLEAAEARIVRNDLDRVGGVAWEERGDGLLVASARSPRRTRAYGLTVDELSPQDVAEVVAWFAGHGVDPQVQLSAWAAPATIAALAGAGLGPGWCRSVQARMLDAPVEAIARAGDPGVSVSRVERDGDLDAFLPVLLRGLRGEEAPIGGRDRERARRELADPDVAQWVASRDGIAVGAGIVALVDGVACLGPAATLPEHRRRGVQSALLAARTSWARTAGADVAFVTAEVDSATSRNAARLGYGLVQQQWVLVPGGASC